MTRHERRTLTTSTGTSFELHLVHPPTVPGSDTAPTAPAAAADRRRGAAVVVLHELWGVNADITGVLENLAGAGYLAVAPEIYPGPIDKSDEGRAAAFGLLRQVTRAWVTEMVSRLLQEVAPDTGHGAAAVGLLGFSAGAHLAWVAASALEVAALAVIYPGWLTETTMPFGSPEPTISLTPSIRARVLYAVGGADHVISADQRAEVKSALSSAGIDAEVVVYPGTGHAFFWPGAPSFDAAARADCWSRVLELFATALPGGVGPEFTGA